MHKTAKGYALDIGAWTEIGLSWQNVIHHRRSYTN